MIKSIYMMELLLPAGSKESFFYAISNGADAIYLGIDKFNARAYASNFKLEELKEYVDYAHLRNVKINVTLNIMLYDEELKEAFKVVDELAKMKVDAIIVNDLILLKYITTNYVSIKAHSSTQMGIDDIYGTKLMKEEGVSRVVLARETPLDTVKDIFNKVDIELEVFAHGALCVSYSGNCLFSSFIGERSGNRGRCAACCRQIYTLIDETNSKILNSGYLLSLKDLNISSYLKDISFVSSLKIEGRMKEPTYVGGVSSIYRKLLDDLNNKNNTSTNKLLINNLNKLFNRGFTKGFMFNESSKDIANIFRPNNKGYLVGEVINVFNNFIKIKLYSKDNDIAKGDQIRIEDESNINLTSDLSIFIEKLFDINKKEILSSKETKNNMILVKNNSKNKSYIKLNSKVYVTKDISYIKEIEEHALKVKEYYKRHITFTFKARINHPISLSLLYKDKEICSSIHPDYLVEEAISNITSKDNIIKQLSKLNDTPFILDNINLDIDSNIFIPLKYLNELRRDVINKLEEYILNEEYKEIKTSSSIKFNNNDYLNLLSNIKVRKYDTNTNNIKEIVVEVSNLEQYEICKKLNIKHIYFKNIVRRNNENYYEDYNTLKEEYNNEILVSGYSSIYKYRLNKDIKLILDSSFNVSNYLSLAYLLSYKNVDRVTLSLELDKDRINNIINNYYNTFKTYPKVELIIYGKTKLMHTKYCILNNLGLCPNCKKYKYSLKDKYEKFNLMFNDDCTMNILNSKALNLIDDISNFSSHINYFRLCFSDESKEEVESILTNFKSILESNSKIKTFNPSKHTRGHYFKSAL